MSFADSLKCERYIWMAPLVVGGWRGGAVEYDSWSPDAE